MVAALPDELTELIVCRLGVRAMVTLQQASVKWRGVLACDRLWETYFCPPRGGGLVPMLMRASGKCELKVRTALVYAHAGLPPIPGARDDVLNLYRRLVRNLAMLRRECWAHWRTITLAAEHEVAGDSCRRPWGCLALRVQATRRAPLADARMVVKLVKQVGLHLARLTATAQHVVVASGRASSPEGQVYIRDTISRLSRRFAFLAGNLVSALQVLRW